MTGVEVTPISGVICPQPCEPLVLSPAPSRDTCHSTAPLSASKAYTESCSVAASTTLCAAPATPSCDRYSGWASTLPSTLNVRSKPKGADVTFARVSDDSAGFRPLRLRSYL